MRTPVREIELPNGKIEYENGIPLFTPKEHKTSEAQLRAAEKWNKKQAQIAIRVKPEVKELLRRKSEASGKSMAQYVTDLIMRDTIESL